MSVPTPKSPLDGHCSAVNDGTLYVLSSDSFQSLPLKENAEWSTLSQGVPVSNPACIKVTPGNDTSLAMMYVIGGTSSNSSYTGVQRNSFADLINRTYHSVAWLENSNQVLVYAVSQPNAVAAYSSQTFTLGLTAPYPVNAYISGAPPGNQPILLGFDNANALLMGSGLRPLEIWTFNATFGWSQYPTTLTAGIPPGVRGLIIDGTNDSKVLATYNANVSPNVVNQFVLAADNGVAPSTAIAVTRDLSLSSWPSYNSSDAPPEIRTDYAVTPGDNGLVVITGGSTNNPLNLFNSSTNGWVDNGLFFDGTADGNKPSSTTASTTNSATASAAASSSIAAAMSSNSKKSKTLRDLGIVLGVLFAIAALFIVGLLLLRYRRQRRKRRMQAINEKFDAMSFQDRGILRNDSTVDLSKIPPNHRFTQRNASSNSFAFVAGKLGRDTSRNNVNNKRNSSDSTRHLVNVRKEDISRPVELDVWGRDKEVVSPVGALHTGQMPVSPLGAPQRPEAALTSDAPRGTGWARYFAAAPNDALPSAYDRGPTVSAYTVASEYTVAEDAPPLPDEMPSSVVMPEPLFGKKNKQGEAAASPRGPGFNSSVTDSTNRVSALDPTHRRKSTDSLGSTHSNLTEDSSYLDSEYRHSVVEAWTPVDSQPDLKANATIVSENSQSSIGKPRAPSSAYNTSPNPNTGVFNQPRAPSSAYTASYYGGGTDSRIISARGNPGFFANNLSSYRPSSRGPQKSPIDATFPMPPMPAEKAVVRDSTATTFPKGVPSGYYAARDAARMSKQKALPKQDMSWLNLGG